MPKKKPLRYRLFCELLLADYDWFDIEVCPESTGCRNEEYFDYLAKRAVKMMKKEGDL